MNLSLTQNLAMKDSENVENSEDVQYDYSNLAVLLGTLQKRTRSKYELVFFFSAIKAKRSPKDVFKGESVVKHTIYQLFY